MIVLLFIMLTFGLSYICLGIKKHQLQAIPNNVIHENNKLSIILGYLLLVLSCLISFCYWGIGMGLVICMATYTLAHISSILLITYIPKQLSFFTGFYWLFHRSRAIK